MMKLYRFTMVGRLGTYDLQIKLSSRNKAHHIECCGLP
jgi:hypothetical protein